MERREAVDFLLNEPYKLGHLLGFNLLTELHNGWIKQMVCGVEDETLQAHRGSYKTTSVSIALAVLCVLLPDKKMMFMRKTDADVKEVMTQVKNILASPYMQVFAQAIYGANIFFLTDNSGELTTSLAVGTSGTTQLSGMGVSGSLTGKHYDIIFTDDIVNVKDRISKAERDHTKLVYQELQNIRNRGGRIFNTGTPWHKEDCFSIMPPAQKYDYKATGLIDAATVEKIKASMTPSLFAANYELRHIAEDDVIFASPQTGADPALAEQGICHIDAAYGGEDYTAMTIAAKKDGAYYLFGKLWHKHVDDVLDEIISYRKAFNAGKIYCENNGDKGYLAKELKRRGERAVTYHEDMNKFLKIATHLKGEWPNAHFIVGTDEAYINQICDYTENAEHDDAPDSAASIIRKLRKKQGQYESLYLIPEI